MEILVLSVIVGMVGGFVCADLGYRWAATKDIANARKEFADNAHKLAELHNTSTEAQKSLHNRMESLELILKSSNNQASVMKRF